MLDSLTEKFSTVAPTAEPPDQTTEPPEQCSRCRGRSWWLPRGQTAWRCDWCDPAPSESLVSQRRDDGPVIVSQCHVTCCVPWCGSCGGWQGIEDVWSDGHAETRCRTCGESMSDWPEKYYAAGDEQPHVTIGISKLDVIE